MSETEAASVQVRTKISPSDYAELRSRADANEQTIQQLVRLILRTWIRDARETQVGA